MAPSKFKLLCLIYIGGYRRRAQLLFQLINPRKCSWNLQSFYSRRSDDFGLSSCSRVFNSLVELESSFLQRTLLCFLFSMLDVLIRVWVSSSQSMFTTHYCWELLNFKPYLCFVSLSDEIQSNKKATCSEMTKGRKLHQNKWKRLVKSQPLPLALVIFKEEELTL